MAKRMKITVTVATEARIESNDYLHTLRVDLAMGKALAHKIVTESGKLVPKDFDDLQKQVADALGHDNFELQVAK